MSGAIHATIVKAGRESERQSMDRVTTVRGDDRKPLDVVIVDLSKDGCKIEGAVDFNVDDLVSVGLPGVGCRSGRVAWIQDGQCGVAFFGPLERQEIAFIRDAHTVVAGSFRQVQSFEEVIAGSRDKRLPPWASATVIVFAAATLWGLVIMIARPLSHF
jgi:hypothetical protein